MGAPRPLHIIYTVDRDQPPASASHNRRHVARIGGRGRCSEGVASPGLVAKWPAFVVRGVREGAAKHDETKMRKSVLFSQNIYFSLSAHLFEDFYFLQLGFFFPRFNLHLIARRRELNHQAGILKANIKIKKWSQESFWAFFV